MDVLNEIRFDDSGIAPDGVCYVGVDRQIVESNEEFYIRSYDDEPNIAIVMEPEDALKSINSKALIEYLKSEYNYERFQFPCDFTGRYEEVDPEKMQFIFVKQD